MISIITPFFNSAKYIHEAISSVISQSYKDWELILINDGSSDKSKEIALSFDDPRIRYFEQHNKGVSAARNIGLNNMNGRYFCFLDADDILPKKSLEIRINKFKSNSTLSFVDGSVTIFEEDISLSAGEWNPTFIGSPLKELIKLTGRCFFNASWLIKIDDFKIPKFHHGLSHGEDLLFLMELARLGGHYDYVEETTLYYRKSPNSAMTNLKALENGYRYVEKVVRGWPELSRSDVQLFKYKYRKAMFLAYLSEFKSISAVKSILN